MSQSSLWPDLKGEAASLEPALVPSRGLLQKITARLWGQRAASGDLTKKHEALWRLLHETDRWFEAFSKWETEGVYRVPGSSVDIDSLFKGWSEGAISSLPPDATPHTIASLLKRGFRDLAQIEPVVPFGKCAPLASDD
jgi:hypothetical protein